MKTLETLLNTLPQQGLVKWIGIRPARRAPMHSVEQVYASNETGLEGDRYQGSTGKRHVTLMQYEHLSVIESCCFQPTVLPEHLRRNVLIAGINLLALKNKRVRIGEVELEITGLCHPCSRMEETLGEGGYNAVRGHGGLTARVVDSGVFKVGDGVWVSR